MSKDTEQPKEAKPGNVGKKPFDTPKLTYVRPKLSKHGKAAQVTQTYFGSFSA